VNKTFSRKETTALVVEVSILTVTSIRPTGKLITSYKSAC